MVARRANRSGRLDPGFVPPAERSGRFDPRVGRHANRVLPSDPGRLPSDPRVALPGARVEASASRREPSDPRVLASDPEVTRRASRVLASASEVRSRGGRYGTPGSPVRTQETQNETLASGETQRAGEARRLCSRVWSTAILCGEGWRPEGAASPASACRPFGALGLNRRAYPGLAPPGYSNGRPFGASLQRRERSVAARLAT